ncbi:hypothetical protein [Tatumella ptyseos]|uniref:Uncharacterized protein n=1 Tax=Tatumella ptyseos TaxID=82987 RepID=A0A2X5NHS2_9GAMM|nr:hypothetical protein [Tatumella ptyseos]SQK72979.1 Uncharacterised protein [Tatumella ptyseos]
MKILTLRFKNLNALRGNGLLISGVNPLPVTGCLPLPGIPVQVKPRCWMLSAWRFITRPQADEHQPIAECTDEPRLQ